MNTRYRKLIIAGNWKMNKTPADTREFFKKLGPLGRKGSRFEAVLCVPAIDIHAAVSACKDMKYSIGAQNLHQEVSGAYTGEISAQMLKSAGVKYVIIGHSERREYFGEDDFTISKKVRAALDNGLRPILCVGESLEHRRAGLAKSLIAYQVAAALALVDEEEISKVVIAYEPIWAIGTGNTATAQDAQEICCHIRSVLREKYGARKARAVSILYGGSMKPDNAAELISMEDIDGGLIGGASLKSEDFRKIIELAAAVNA